MSIEEAKKLGISTIYYRLRKTLSKGKRASNLERTGTIDKPSYAEYTDQEAMNRRLLEITLEDRKRLNNK